MSVSQFSNLRAIAIVIAVIAYCGAVATAQSDGEACSSRTTAYARAASAIRNAPNHDAASLGSTAPGDKLDIISSQRRGPWCWLQISAGWIVDSGLALSAQPVAATAPPQAVRATGGSCFAGATAYITGSMNIRASFNASSAITGSAWAGLELAVTDSRRGPAWCWLKVNGGWIADTSRVQAHKPSREVVASPAQPVESAPVQQPVSEPVDNCCNVDRQCRTDREWTDGYWAYQNGQCAAPARRQASTQPVASASTNADNCCGIDRQCYTDWDWTVGFYAFRDNQCQGAVSSRQATAGGSSALSQTHATLPGLPVTRSTVRLSTFKFDNCCYMDPGAWRCTSQADWQRGYANFQNHVCKHPLPVGTRPAIVGPPKFHYLVENALELIRLHAPEWLNYIYSSGAHMFQLRPLGQWGGFYNTEWSIGHSWTQQEREDPNWLPDYNYFVGYAGGITHEACHAMQQRTHMQSLEAWRHEKECTEAQLAVIEAINPNSPDIPWLRDTIANIENPDYWWW